MKVHHLNCGSHCPAGGALFDGVSRGFLADIPTHCLLIETDQGLVLVDTGYGLLDVIQPHHRLPWIWPALLNVCLREEDTALRQIEALGHSARDVRHIVLTHLDFDHAGGIEDFPEARVHLLSAERIAADCRRGFVAAQRYRPALWDAVTEWRTYAPEGEQWFGFDAVRTLDGLPPEILLVPLRGHTEGHAGVAVSTPQGWMLHAGDAYLHRASIMPGQENPPGLALYQHVMDTDRPERRRNQERLAKLRADHSSQVQIFCSHDRAELNSFQSGSGAWRNLPTLQKGALQ